MHCRFWLQCRSMKEDMMQKITKDMIIAEILNVDPAMADILQAEGMHCVYCPSQSGETLEAAAMVHGLDADTLVDRMNEYLSLK